MAANSFLNQPWGGLVSALDAGDNSKAEEILHGFSGQLDSYFSHVEYKPTVSQNLTNASSYAAQKGFGLRIGSWVLLNVMVSFSDTMPSAGALLISLPPDLPAVFDNTLAFPIGQFTLTQSSTSSQVVGWAYADNFGKVIGGIGGTSPVPLGALGSAFPGAASGGITLRATVQYRTLVPTS